MRARVAVRNGNARALTPPLMLSLFFFSPTSSCLTACVRWGKREGNQIKLQPWRFCTTMDLAHLANSLQVPSDHTLFSWNMNIGPSTTCMRLLKQPIARAAPAFVASMFFFLHSRSTQTWAHGHVHVLLIFLR
jgi:hypothetical protein